MSEGHFILKGAYHSNKCLPDLNDIISMAWRNPKTYGRWKHGFEALIINSAHLGLKRWKPKSRVRIDITWGEPKKGQKRDFDNIVAGRKFLNDALVRANILQDDSPKYIAYGNNEFVYTDGEPFMDVTIVEIEDLSI